MEISSASFSEPKGISAKIEAKDTNPHVTSCLRAAMVLQAIRYVRGSLEILDQLRLPHEEKYINISSTEDAWHAIRSMQVRGAPAIAIVAVLSLAVVLHHDTPISENLVASGAVLAANQRISDDLRYLVTSRHTAVNLADAARKLEGLTSNAAKRSGATPQRVVEAYIHGAEQMLLDDVKDNESIGSYGASWILKHLDKGRQGQKISVLTHCNTGSLATAGFGTALGVVRSLHARGSLNHVYYTETRPYNQGSRLTGYELIHDDIPATLITDSMAAALFQLKGQSENIAAVVVGADRVAANGDTANKIGTYALAILARHHNTKFLVAAPRTTIDLSTGSGKEIIIEERSPSEVTTIKGPPVTGKTNDATHIIIAAKGTQAWNPAFDVTPHDLIDGIVTDRGVVQKGADGKFDWSTVFDLQDLSVQMDHQGANGHRLAENDVLERYVTEYPGKRS